MPLKSASCGRELEAGLRRRPGSNNVTFDGKPPDGVDPVLAGVDEMMHLVAVAILRKPYRLDGEELRFLRKHVELNQEEFAKLLHVDKTTLSKWENNEDRIGVQSDLWARTVAVSHDKRLGKRAGDYIRAFEKIADKQKHVRVEVDALTREYEYA